MKKIWYGSLTCDFCKKIGLGLEKGQLYEKNKDGEFEKKK